MACAGSGAARAPSRVNMNVNSFIALIMARRWLTILFSLLLTASLAAGAQYIVPVDVDVRNHFSKDDPHLIELERLEDTYAISETALVAVAPKNGTVFTREALGAVEELTERLWQTPYVTRVDSITNYSHSRGVDDELIVNPLIDAAGSLSDDDLERIENIALETEEVSGRLVSRDGRVAGLIVSMVFPDENRQAAMDKAVDFLHGIAAEARTKHATIEYHLVGELLLNRAFRSALDESTSVQVPVAFGTMLVVAMVLLRSFWGVVSIAILIGAVLLSGLGFAGWVGLDLYGESGGALFVLMVVTVAHAVHIIEAVRSGLRQGMDRRQAAIHAVEFNIWPVFLTSFTTAIGFLSLNLSEMPPFRVMGNIVAFGSMCAFVYAVTFLPAFISLMPLRRGHEGKRNFFDNLGGFVVSRHRTLLWSFGTVAVVLIAGISRIELDTNLHVALDQRFEYRRASDFVSENFTGLELFEYSLSADQEGGVTDTDYLHRVDAFAEWFRDQPEVAHVYGLTDIMKRLNKNLNNDSPDFYTVPDASDLAAQYLLLYEFSLPVGLDLNNLIDMERSSTRVTVVLKALSASEKINLDNRARAWLRENAPSLETGASGMAIVGAYSNMRNIEIMLMGTAIAMGIVSFLLIFVFRSLRFGMISLIPNFLPAAMAMGLWGYVVKEVDVAASVVTALAFGVIVDDTIHFMTKYLRSRKEGLSPSDSVRSAFSTVGKALLATTVVFVLGFLVFGSSGMAMNQTLGLLMGITIIAALVADFLFLPPLLMVLDGTRETGEQVRERSRRAVE